MTPGRWGLPNLRPSSKTPSSGARTRQSHWLCAPSPDYRHAGTSPQPLPWGLLHTAGFLPFAFTEVETDVYKPLHKNSNSLADHTAQLNPPPARSTRFRFGKTKAHRPLFGIGPLVEPESDQVPTVVCFLLASFFKTCKKRVHPQKETHRDTPILRASPDLGLHFEGST